jgi:hypothetical protein
LSDEQRAERKIDGVSLMPLLRGEMASGQLAERALYWDYPHYGNQGGAPASAVREGKWKLIEWREGERLELFDLEADPGESRNAANEHADIVRRLREVLGAWREDVKVIIPSQNPRFDASLPLNRDLPPEAGKAKPTRGVGNAK